MARLIVRYPDNRIQEVEFDKTLFRIGSALDNDLVVSYEEVEPHHAEITNEAGAFFIRNLSDRENTTVNGKKIDRINLNYGDRIALGPVVCLFYPETKKRVSAKPKLYMFIGGAALLIVLSIVLVFYFTTKRISTVVGEKVEIPEIVKRQPGMEKVTSPETGEKKRPPIIKEHIRGVEVEKPQAAEKPLIKKPVVVQPEVLGGEKEAFLKRIFSAFRGEKISLPEPTHEEIQSRQAIAVPRGLKRIFFKKVVVVVSPELLLVEAKKSQEEVQQGKGGLVEEHPQAPGALGAGVEVPGASEEIPSGQVLAEEALPEEKTGFFARVFINPLKGLFKGGKEEEITTLAPGIPAEGEAVVGAMTPAEKTEGTGTPTGEKVPPSIEKPVIEKPVTEEVLKLTDPIAYLKSLELPIFKEESFVEKPVYSENEIMEFTREKLIGEVKLSEGENINTGIVWEYPWGVVPGEEGARAHVSTTGTIGDMNGDKKPDFIFGTKEGDLIYLNGIDGSELVRQSFNTEILEPVYLSDKKLKRIVISAVNGRIESYDSELNQMWIFKEKNSLTTQPLAADLNDDGIRDLVYNTVNMEVFAIDGKTGLELWRFFDLESEPLWAPAGCDVNGDGVEDVLVLTRGGKIHAIDGRSGWGLWVNEIYGLPLGPPLVFDIDRDKKNEIICLTRRGILSVFNTEGNPLFTYDLKRRFRVVPSGGDFDGDKIPEIALVDINGGVISFEPVTRRVDWELETEDPNIIGRVAIADMNSDGMDDIIFNSLSGLLYIVDGSAGSLLAQHNLGDYILSTPVVYDLNGDKMPEIIESTYSGKVLALMVGELKSGLFSKMLRKKPEAWESINGNSLNTGYNRGSKNSLFGK